jgi:hypothetical protein
MNGQLVYRTSKRSKFHLIGLVWTDATACASRRVLPDSGIKPADVPAARRCTQLACRPAWETDRG